MKAKQSMPWTTFRSSLFKPLSQRIESPIQPQIDTKISNKLSKKRLYHQKPSNLSLPMKSWPIKLSFKNLWHSLDDNFRREKTEQYYCVHIKKKIIILSNFNLIFCNPLIKFTQPTQHHTQNTEKSFKNTI